MASISYPKSKGQNAILSTLLENAVATTNGEWVPVLGFQPFTVQVDGVTTATVEVRGHNGPTKPANTSHGALLKSFTADGMTTIIDPIVWVKSRILAYTSGTISSWLCGYAERQRMP
jgi:hypothetical protein